MRSVAVGREVKRPVSVFCGLAWYGWLLYLAAAWHWPHHVLTYALRVGRGLLVVAVLVDVRLRAAGVRAIVQRLGWSVGCFGPNA